MELRHLRYFCAVAEHRSFSTAGRLLNVSQSGVSGQVRALEKELGISLLSRAHREVTLTPEGTVFYAEALDILHRANRAVEMATLASKGNAGKLNVGLCGPVTMPFLPKLIRAFHKKFPAVVVAIREREPSEQIAALLDGQIDIAFARGIPADAKHLVHSQLLFREPVIVALPKGHPFEKSPSVHIKHLASQKLILPARDSAHEVFDSIIATCQKARFSPKIIDTPRSWQALLTMVEANEGLGLIPQCVELLRGNDVVFRPLEEPGCWLDAIVAWRRNDAHTTQKAFLQMLETLAPNYGRDAMLKSQSRSK